MFAAKPPLGQAAPFYILKARKVRGIDMCVQRSWQMLTGESPVVVKVGQPLSQ